MDFKITDVTPSQKVDTSKVKEKAVGDDFSFTLKRLGDEGLMERINGLMASIRAQGDQIAKHMDIRDMRAYRALITEFINEVITKSYKFTRENYLNRRGHHMVYSIVKLINKDLDDLAQELLKDEKDHIAILDKTGEIQGLLLDLMI